MMGRGSSVYPYYGVAPHGHDDKFRTYVLPESEWPDNFSEDPEASGLGTYMHCPKCGAR